MCINFMKLALAIIPRVKEGAKGIARGRGWSEIGVRL